MFLITFAPKDFQVKLDSARLAVVKTCSGLCLDATGTSQRVFRLWKTMFLFMQKGLHPCEDL